MSSEVSADALASFEQYRQNLKWARQNGDDLEKYAGKYVAVANGKVLDSAPRAASLEARYKDVPGVAIMVVVRRGLKWVL